MGVDVEQTGKKGAAAGVDGLGRSVRCVDGRAAVDSHNRIAAHGDGAILDDGALLILGDDQRMANDQVD